MQRSTRFLLPALLALGLVWSTPALAQAFGGGGGPNSKGEKRTMPGVASKLITVRGDKFPFSTPGGKWQALGTALTLPTVKPVKVTIKGTKAGFDLTGRGRPTFWVSEKGGNVKVQVHGDGQPDWYVARVAKRDGKWVWRRNCYRTVTLKGTPMVLIDDNSNGTYADFGKDALVVGRSKDAYPMSDQVALRGQIYTMSVPPGASRIELIPNKVDVGRLQLSYKGPGKLALAVVKTGQSHFEVSRPAVLPAGAYQLTMGVITQRDKRVSFKGERKGIALTKGKATKFKLGAEFEVSAQINRAGPMINVPYGGIVIRGAGGERYYEFTPTLMPRVVIRDAKTQKEVKAEVFKEAKGMLKVQLPDSHKGTPVEVRIETDSALGKLHTQWKKM